MKYTHLILAVAASATAQYMNHTSTPSTTPDSAPTVVTKASTIQATNLPAFQLNGYTWLYDGCFSLSDIGNNTKFLATPNMTIEACAGSCAGSTYAGLIQNGCYCITTLLAPAKPATECDAVCPGSSAEICGGSTSGIRRLTKRDALDFLLSVYMSSVQADGTTAVEPSNTSTPLLVTSTPSQGVVVVGRAGNVAVGSLFALVFVLGVAFAL